MRIGRIRLIWLILGVLTAFVIFVEFIADTGGSAQPNSATPVSSPAATRGGPLGYPWEFSSNTSSVLS